MEIAARGWPLPNVWLGVSVEDQLRAYERIPHLLRTPAAVRFISAEPLLGPLDISPWVPSSDGFVFMGDEHGPVHVDDGARGIDWVIVGGESGPQARPCDLAWIRSIRDQCAAAGVPCFIKQLGSRAIADGIPCTMSWVDEQTGLERCRTMERIVELNLCHKKGGDPAEWPEDLRVRQWPVSFTTEAQRHGEE